MLTPLKFNLARHRTTTAPHLLALPLGKPDDAVVVKRQQKPALNVDINISANQAIECRLNITQQGKHISKMLDIQLMEIQKLKACQHIYSKHLFALSNPASSYWQVSLLLKNCAQAVMSALNHQRYCYHNSNSPSLLLSNQAHNFQTASNYLKACQTINHSLVYQLNHHSFAHWQGKHQVRCLPIKTSKAIPVPCEWYTIEIPEPPVLPHRCVYPDSQRLHLPLNRLRISHNPRQIPLPLACKAPRAVIPTRDTYMNNNIISATCNDIALNPININLQTNMDAYCWTGSITLPPEDFAQLKLHNYHHGNEPLITLTINGERYTFIAEEYSDNRQFGQKSYTVSGRSQTARLGADFAQYHNHIVSQTLYARQIADSVLQDTGYRIAAWQIPDWLVPANIYGLTDKTPIDVIKDIAQVAGGFVESDPDKRILNVKLRHKTPAWQLTHAQADLSIPANVILSITGQKHITAQCYGVYVSATHDKGKFIKVIRKASAGSPEATMLSHELYTDESVCQSAGINALSDTGTYKTEQIELPMLPKYALNRAKLGEIWRINESVGAFNGVVRGVSINVSQQNNAPRIIQNVELFRYMGE